MTKTIEEQYQKKTPIEHILLRPDTYIGSVEPESLQAYTMAGDNIEYRTITYVPGLFKIFDEIIVNAADNKIRDPSMKCIKVNIENDTISVYNDGKGIPVVLHKTEKVYIPELIFGQLLTSSNYDDKEKKITGGRNGYGAKLCNIFSDEFIVETSDGKKEYKQVFQNNMSVKQEPVIKSCYKEYTRITFKPDYKRFGMTHLDDDTISLLKKRVYDLCGTVKNIRVYYNDVKIEIKNFKEYCMMYLKKNNEETIDTKSLVHAVVNDRWEVVFYPSEDQFQQVSFVNSICTLKGGTHVSHVLDQLVDPVIEHIKKKEKGLVVKPMQVKSNMFLFINCLIVNPSFDSQTKENLTLNYKKFGSKCEPMDDFVKNILKSGTFLEKVVRNAKAKQSAQLKKTDGTKTSRLTGVPKLDDANMAGTKLSHRCTLILTEGDSAKALAVSGLSVVGRDYYGVFPLRGKMLNVRDAAHKQIMENNEIIAIKKILGLKHGEDYTTVESLRYGHIMIMTDQDHDGSHIKGLLINFLDHFYPSLLKIEGFLQEFITPIVRVTLKKDARSAGNTIDFFTLPEFYKWQEETPDSDKYKVKYYKGLGTSTSQDAKYYFSDLPKHVKNFTPLVDADKELLSLAFAKKRADARKNWLKDFVPGTYLDNSISLISISDFVNKELILFSMADNIRSIPSVVDGLKPGQRKVIFSCFKRKLSGEIKVAQLAGYVSEHSAYHHGEQSLCSTIVNLAQNNVGSNNINLLVPAGQFGTRLQGGKDAASSRYIFTFLERLTRIIFNEQDDNILNYNNEDNQSIEPDFYMPIIPMVLVNGAEGIGTGWSTSVPNYNVLDIVDNLRRMLKDQEPTKMKPWYRGFKGQIVEDTDKKNKTEEGKTKRSKKIVFDEDIKLIQTESPENSPSLTESIRYKISGIYDFDGDSIEITELPVGVWTQNYKEFLESLVADGEIKDFKEYHTENTVHFKIKNSKITANNVEKKLKLTTTISANNIVCFDRFGFIKRYANPEDILKDFYSLRLEYYTKRKEFMLKKLFDDLLKMENRVRFIKEVIDETLVLKKRKKDDIEIDMLGRKYDKIENSYDYLLNMPLLSLTVERIDKLNLERTEKRKEYDCLLKKSNKDLWNEDLDSFVAEYKKWLNTFVEDEKPVKAIGGRKRRTAAK